MILPAGVYEHYSGKRYLVLGCSRHSETGEIDVVYVPLYPTNNGAHIGMSHRPLDMFLETVPDPKGSGAQVNRFRYIA